MLTIARQIRVTPNQHLAKAVIAVIKNFAQENRLDAPVILRLNLRRKLETYCSPDSDRGTILEYLVRDSDESIEVLNLEWFQAYRTLMLVHDDKEDVILQACRNLRGWLSQLPNSYEQRMAFMKDAERARRGTFDLVGRQVSLHLEAHTVFLPGKRAEDDLLVHLQNRYNNQHDWAVAAAGLKVLRYLPNMRARAKDVCDYLQDKHQFHGDFWQAAFDLIEHLITGLPDVVPTLQTEQDILSASLQTMLSQRPYLKPRIYPLLQVIRHDKQFSETFWDDALRVMEQMVLQQPDIISEVEDWTAEVPVAELEQLVRRRKKQARARKTLLQADAQLRHFLYSLSHDANHRPEVRQKAWRILLSSLPQERESYYREVLTRPSHELFMTSLEVAEQTMQRDIWKWLADTWQELTTPSAPKRRERLAQVCQTLKKLRHFGMVSPLGNGLPSPLISLALDDHDAEIRHLAKEAIGEAGYGAELEREEQRREAVRLRKELAEIENSVLELEAQGKALQRQVWEEQSKQQQYEQEIQHHLQNARAIVSQSYIATAQLQVELQDIQNQLSEELRRAKPQERFLQSLANQLAMQSKGQAKCQEELNRLVTRRERAEKRISNAERTRREAQQAIKEAYDKIQNISRRQPPTAPEIVDRDPQAERKRKKYQKECEKFKKEQQKEIKREEQARERAERRVADGKKMIREIRHEVRALESGIEQVSHRRAEVEAQVQALRNDFSNQEAILNQIRARIAKLEHDSNALRARIREIQQKQEAERRQAEQNLASSKRRLSEVTNKIHRLSQSINQVQLDIREAQAQAQTLQERIATVQTRHQNLSEEALSASPQIDQQAAEAKRVLEWKEWETQESLIFYTHAIKDALKHQQIYANTEMRRER